jgi:hypothetical protein
VQHKLVGGGGGRRMIKRVNDQLIISRQMMVWSGEGEREGET